MPVRVMRFEELDAEAAFDAVWASASLLHARADALPDVLAKVRRALRPGGRFFASFKLGEGGDRDKFGRYYNFPTKAGLLAAYETAGPWASLSTHGVSGSGYDGVDRDWLMCLAVRP
jgi:SAM-dependent methyltransferase